MDSSGIYGVIMKGENTMKKLVFLTLVIVCMMTFGVNAKDRSVTELAWDNFTQTCDFSNQAGEGELGIALINSTIHRERADNEDATQTLGRSDLEINYDYMVNEKTQVSLILSGHYNYYNSVDQSSTGQGTSIYIQGKRKFYEKNGLEMAADGYFGNMYNMNKFGGTFCTDFNWKKDFTLYNYLKFSGINDDMACAIYSGAEWIADDKNTFRFNLGANPNDLAFGIAYRGKYTDQLTYMATFYRSVVSDAFILTNYLEGEIIPSLTLTGQIRYGLHSGVQNFVGIDATEKLGPVTLSGNYYHYLPTENVTGYELSASVKIDVTKAINLKFSGQKNFTLSNIMKRDEAEFKVGVTREL